ncbi:MAG: hypothetical protein ACI9Y7_000920 [Dokdonia sp.]|jgi:hypothetical protein
MKHITIFCILFLTISTLVAQKRPAGSQPVSTSQIKLPADFFNTPQQANPTTLPDGIEVRSFLSSMVSRNVLTDQDTDYVITSEHISSISGIHHIYYRQAISGIEVQGTESSVHLKSDGSLFRFIDRNLIKNISSKIKSAGSMTATQAIQGITNQMGYRFPANLTLDTSALVPGYEVYIDYSSAGGEILTKEAYYLFPDGSISKAWEVIFPEKTTSSVWSYWIDASSGEIIDKHDLTVSCNIIGEHDHAHETKDANTSLYTEADCEDISVENTSYGPLAEDMAFMDGTYRVYALPLESPFYGNRTLVTNPADATASPFGWHDTNGAAGAEFTNTRGNNTHTYEDLANNNDLPGDTNPSTDIPGTSPDGGASLTFDYAFDLTAVDGDSGFTIPRFNTTNRSLDAATTNTFYWTNIIHDITYQYGFDEASGNFQENNYSNGGAGSDSVNAEVQDGGSTCNANFFTLPDGTNARMQMYVCDFVDPGYDGDYDNLVIVHEYAHGISSRLTGGASNANALNNAEQMGEGWSDYYGYMLTMDATNFDADRNVGTFLFGGTPAGGINGTGIRDAPYTGDRDVAGANQFVHTSINILPGNATPNPNNAPHSWGQVWATFLYDLTQNLMDEYGFDADLYNGTGGNNISLSLVTEALKLQPASPGFVDGRDAILAADAALYDGANQCIIWETFANRGLGFSASQGSSNNRADNTNAFDVPSITLNVTDTDICLANGTTSLSGGIFTGGTYSGSGVTDDGNGSTFTFDPVTAGVGVHTITYNATDCNGMMASDTDTITVTEVLPQLSACQNASIAIGADGTAIFDPLTPTSAVVVGGNNTPGGGGSQGFSVLSVTATEDVTVSFDWQFVTSDGTGNFDNIGFIIDAAYFPLSDASAASQNGNFSIAITAGQIFGFAAFTTDNGFGNASGTFTNFSPGYTGQFASNNWSETLQNSDGSAAFSGASASLINSCGDITTSLSQSIFTCQDLGVNTVTITVTDSLGNEDTCTAQVTVTGSALNTTEFIGGAWDNGDPTGTSMAMIRDDYDTSTPGLGSITACSCQVDTDQTLTIRDGDHLSVAGNIVVDGTLVVENEGSVVQIDEDAITTNNGSISVSKITPSIDDRNYVAMSSPMSAETRDGVYGNSRAVFSIIPSNFVPFAIDLMTFPEYAGAENFIDDDNDYLLPVTGSTALPAAGIGQLVFPQPAPNVGDGAYTLTYTQGTLHSGTITVPINYNGPATVNNYNLLGNPYASAIDVNAFITANDAVNEVYYWDHITNPTSALPGPGTSNFSMNDISIRNAMMGTVAVNTGGPTEPGQFMASGHGFGIKALQSEAMSNTPVVFTNSMRVTGNNDGFRSNEAVSNPTFDRLWLNLTTSAYENATSQAAVGFTDLATPEFDNGYDTKRLGTFLSLFTNLDGEYLAIQGRETFNTQIALDLGFATTVETEETYTISIDRFEGTGLEEAPIYVIDNLLNTITNLKESPYTFTATKGIQPDRFIVVFEERDVLSIEDEVIDANAITLYPNPASKEITLGYSGSKQLLEATIINLTGQKVQQLDLSNFNQSQRFTISDLSKGMYFIQIVSEDQTVVKKLIVK